MVLPTPFERLLQDIANLANRDAGAAFARMDELYGKATSAHEVQQLGSLSIQLGCTGLGRYDDTIAYQKKLQQHPAVAGDDEMLRSLWRGLAVVLLCAGRRSEADEAGRNGVTTPSESCRLALMAGHTLVLRGRPGDAIEHLRTAARVCAGLEAGDEVVAQCASISTGLMRLFEPQIRLAHDALSAAAAIQAAAGTFVTEWRTRHRIAFQQGHVCLLAGRPAQALDAVQQMMALEDQHDADALERFYTASLACRAQYLRGQPRLAAGALEACQDFAKRVDNAQEKPGVETALKELEAFAATLGQ